MNDLVVCSDARQKVNTVHEGMNVCVPMSDNCSNALAGSDNYASTVEVNESNDVRLLQWNGSACNGSA